VKRAMSKMKPGLFFFLMIIVSNSFYGQDVNELFFDEAVISFNRTNLKDDNTENRNGFGLGVYHSFFAKSRVNLTFGAEYNRTSQFKKYMYVGHYAHSTDITYNLNMISFPVGARLNIGNKVKVFADAGGYADVMIKSTSKGMLHTYLPDQYGQVVYKDVPFDQKADLSSVIGAYAGLGIRIPLSLFELVIRTDYKYGFNELYSDRDNIYNRYWRISVGIRQK
jgi:hypothetical protein